MTEPTLQFKIYSKIGCQYCEKAKRLLDDRSLSYTELVLGQDYTKEDLQALINQERVTVPQIWVNGFYVGTSSHLEKYLETI